jgi:hypothetical protein
VTLTDDRPIIPLSAIGSLGRDTAILGIQLGGEWLTWNRRHSAFLLGSGEQGAGKSVLLRVLQCHDLAVRNIPVLLEVKPGDGAWLKGIVSRAITPAGCLRALRWATKQMEERQYQCEAHGVPNIADVDSDTPWITLYIDEAPGLWGDEAAYDLGDDGRDEAVTLTAKLAKRGRSARVTMIATTQDPTLYGTFGKHKAGGSIRRNFNARMHFDADTDSIRAAFDGLITRATLTHLEHPAKGRCGALGLNPADGTKAVAAQIWHITPDLARPFAAAYQGPPPIDFDRVSTTREYHP